MSYWLHGEAEAELGDAAVYYAAHANKAVATSFVDEFDRVMVLLVSNQQLGTLKQEGLRVYPLRRFPFSVVYRETHDAGPQVYAVAHQSREPGYWEGRISR